jgi:prephenate dehydrogenase/prephenate dehydratase
VFSHTQAINQCTNYLSSHLTHASLSYTESTAAAIELVEREKLINAAVIGAKETLLEHGFEILAEDIANVVNNRTRFAILRRGDISDAEKLCEDRILQEPELGHDYVTTIAIDPKRDRKGLLYDILTVISIKHSINMLSIHSRPKTAGDFVFFLDLEGHAYQNDIRQCLLGLKEYCRAETDDDTEISVLGAYQHTSFRPMRFNHIGIVGGNGRMGKWFEKFFAEAGYPVLIQDVDTSISLADVASSCDVILLSVPMSEASTIAEKLLALAKPPQLIVENCSIKDCMLPALQNKLPDSMEVMGIHTMFGPDIPALKGEHVIITKTPSSGIRAKAFEDLLYKHGAKIVHADSPEHDSAVAYMQSLQHLVALALAEVSSAVFSDVSSLDCFQTRNSREVIGLIRRVIKQSDGLITDLQTLNPKAVTIRRKFLESMFRLVSALENEDPQALLEVVDKARAFFGQDKARD